MPAEGGNHRSPTRPRQSTHSARSTVRISQKDHLLHIVARIGLARSGPPAERDTPRRDILAPPGRRTRTEHRHPQRHSWRSSRRKIGPALLAVSMFISCPPLPGASSPFSHSCPKRIPRLQHALRPRGRSTEQVRASFSARAHSGSCSRRYLGLVMLLLDAVGKRAARCLREQQPRTLMFAACFTLFALTAFRTSTLAAPLQRLDSRSRSSRRLPPLLSTATRSRTLVDLRRRSSCRSRTAASTPPAPILLMASGPQSCSPRAASWRSQRALFLVGVAFIFMESHAARSEPHFPSHTSPDSSSPACPTSCPTSSGSLPDADCPSPPAFR